MAMIKHSKLRRLQQLVEDGNAHTLVRRMSLVLGPTLAQEDNRQPAASIQARQLLHPEAMDILDSNPSSLPTVCHSSLRMVMPMAKPKVHNQHMDSRSMEPLNRAMRRPSQPILHTARQAFCSKVCRA